MFILFILVPIALYISLLAIVGITTAIGWVMDEVSEIWNPKS